MRSKDQSKKRKTRRRGLAIAAASVLGEVGVLRSRGYGFGGNVIVRCRDGHLFTTIWIPAASVKSVRLGPWRVQRCPVGNHWSLVTPVKRSELSDEELAFAAQHRDARVP
jgi:hypothetical protein